MIAFGVDRRFVSCMGLGGLVVGFCFVDWLVSVLGLRLRGWVIVGCGCYGVWVGGV